MSGRLSSPNLSGIEQFGFEPRRVEKPWGHELIWALTDQYAGKLLSIEAGHALSLQFHREKDESWYVLDGRAELELAAAGEKAISSEVVTPGAAFRIEPGTVHRIRALEDTVIIEVSTPHLEDVVRLEDSYGRAPKP
ncbi:MAG TPA: cupin domain-containing protein [Gaiellaceae bacterium]|nr:cupin domain-containing protein [Gaiellaceae bacterium]